MHFLINFTHDWYDGLNDVHRNGLKAEYLYMYLEGIDDTDCEYHF